jgi:uncharacterized membrane protein
MREAMLITHFLGLVMGLGSSFAFMFLGRAGSKMEKGEGQKFTLNTFAMSRMGHIGLTLLVLSGGYLMTPFWPILSSSPLLIAKLILVFVLLVTVSLLSVYAKRAKKGETEANLKKIASLGKVSLLSGISIVVLAVLIFR